MPRWLRHFLRSRTLEWHFYAALIAGLAARTLCAIFVYGPQALDDYKHGVIPAYQFFSGQVMDLPDYRSHLLVWLLASFIKIGSLFGASSALAQVRVMYFGLGIFSLLGIYGTYLFVVDMPKSARPSQEFGALALYMVSLFPAMPFIGTRAFGEAVAMSLVLLGFGVLEPARQSREGSVVKWAAGFALIGVATLFRFHVGLIYFGYAGVLAGRALLRKNEKYVWRALLGALCAGLFTLAAQAFIDIMSGKAAFGTLISYLHENQGGAAQYGVSPWYNTWLFVLVLTLPPFSFVLVKHVPSLWRRHWPWLVPFLIYVLAHSLVPHKEERFLYPIVGLELWALAWLWAAGALDSLARRIFTPAVFGLGIPLLLVACFVNTQEGEIGPPAFAESHFHSVIYLDDQSLFGMSRIRDYYLRPPSLVVPVDKEDLNARKIDESLEAHPKIKAAVLLTSVKDALPELHALEGIQTMEARCREMRTSGSLIDRILYGLNPKHNERRRPTWYLVCVRERS